MRDSIAIFIGMCCGLWSLAWMWHALPWNWDSPPAYRWWYLPMGVTTMLIALGVVAAVYWIANGARK